MTTYDVLFRVGCAAMLGGFIVECVGLVGTKWMRLHRAIGVQAMAFLLWIAGVVLMVVARTFDG